MKILSVDDEPLDSVRALNAVGRGEVEEVSIPVLRGTVDSLPEGIDALVAAGDLQALEPGPGRRLVGHAVAERLVALAGAGRIPAPGRTGVLLAGDLYTVPDLAKRGGSGDVRSVWLAFAGRFLWTAAVLGNHDEVGPRNRDLRAVSHTPRLHVLDGSVRDLGGLRVGGVHGIIGNPTRLNRRSEPDFVGQVESVLADGADVLLLHEGPDASAQDGSELRGSPAVRAALEGSGLARPPLVVCGHSWWPVALAVIGGVQVLKVDARVVVLVRG